jgi:AcrR family transcriptional regulator
VPGADPPDELKGRQRQVESAQDHVQSYNGRVLQEARVVVQRLAERLGFTTMALYRHVPGKAELIDVMVDAACGEPPELGVAAGGRLEKLELWARESYGLFVRHPWMLQVVTSRRLMGPNELAWFDSGLGAVSGIGLTGEEMVEILILVNAYVRGLAQALVDVARAERDTCVSEGRWYSAYEPLLKRFDREERYPALRGILAEGAFDEADDGSAPMTPWSSVCSVSWTVSRRSSWRGRISLRAVSRAGYLLSRRADSNR